MLFMIDKSSKMNYNNKLIIFMFKVEIGIKNIFNDHDFLILRKYSLHQTNSLMLQNIRQYIAPQLPQE